MRHWIRASVLLLIVASPVLPQCQPNGLALAYQGKRLGDPFTLTITGSPGVPGLLGVDAAGGSVSTPIGPLCLGLTPALQLVPFTLDPLGSFTFSGILPLSPALIGASTFLQGAAVDPLIPGGTAISNNASVTFRSPRLIMIGGGSAPPLGSFAGSVWCTYDAHTLAPLVTPVALPALVIAAPVLVPSLGWIVFSLYGPNGYFLQCYDLDTGALTLTIPTVAGGKLAVDGNVLCLMTLQTAGPVVSAYVLPSGSLLFNTLLTSGDVAIDVVMPPGSGKAYVIGYQAVMAVDLLAGGVELPALWVGYGPPGTLPGITDWVLHGSTLYTLVGVNGIPVSPASLSAINTSTHQPLLPAPVVWPVGTAVGSPMWYGPCPSGECLFVTDLTNPAAPLTLVSPSTLLPIGNVPGAIGGSGVFSVFIGKWMQMMVSPGGTEWLRFCRSGDAPFGCAGGATLQILQIPSLTISATYPSVPYPPMGANFLVTVPSATLRYGFMISGTTMWPFGTDPVTFFPTPVTLPFPPGRVLVD